MNLQKASQGLLSWFNLKTTGQNPNVFGDSIVPIVDVGDNYLAQGELGIDTITQASGLVSFLSMDFTVPNGKVWRVHAAGGDIGLNVADTALTSRGFVQVLAPDAGVIGCNLSNGPVEAVGVSPREIGFFAARPIFLTPQWRVRVGFLFSGALTVSVNGHAALFRNQFDL